MTRTEMVASLDAIIARWQQARTLLADLQPLLDARIVTQLPPAPPAPAPAAAPAATIAKGVQLAPELPASSAPEVAAPRTRTRHRALPAAVAPAHALRNKPPAGPVAVPAAAVPRPRLAPAAAPTASAPLPRGSSADAFHALFS